MRMLRVIFFQGVKHRLFTTEPGFYTAPPLGLHEKSDVWGVHDHIYNLTRLQVRTFLFLSLSLI